MKAQLFGVQRSLFGKVAVIKNNQMLMESFLLNKGGLAAELVERKNQLGVAVMIVILTVMVKMAKKTKVVKAVRKEKMERAILNLPTMKKMVNEAKEREAKKAKVPSRTNLMKPGLTNTR